MVKRKPVSGGELCLKAKFIRIVSSAQLVHINSNATSATILKQNANLCGKDDFALFLQLRCQNNLVLSTELIM